MTRKPRTTKPKVWGGNIFVEGNQCRAFVAAHNQREAVEFLNKSGVHYVSFYELQTYWAVTGNKAEIIMATHELGKVFYYPRLWGFPERLEK